MKKKLKILKTKLSGSIDYSAVIKDLKYGGYSFEIKYLDYMSIAGGKLCVFDAFSLFSNCKPFDTVFPERAQPYSIEVSTNKGKRVAFSGLKFKEALPVKWKIAVFGGDDYIKLQNEDGIVGTSIPSGYVCYGSCDALKEYENLVKLSENIHPLDGLIGRETNAADHCVWSMSDGLSVAVFATGWGDGYYKSFIGYGESGDVISFITDYEMISPDFKQSQQFVDVEADVSVEELYTINPHFTETENHIAKWSMAIASLSKSDSEGLFNAYSRRGYAYHSAQKYREALDDYLKAIALTEEMNRDNPCLIHAWTIYDNAGNIYRQLGQTKEAIKIFEQAKLCNDIFYNGAFSNLIDIYLSDKNLDKALEIALEMKQQRPDDANAYHRCAEIYVSMEDYQNAVKEYDVLIDRFLISEYIFEKVACLSSLNRFDKAQETLERYLIDNKANELYYYNLGLIKYRKKDFLGSHGDLIRAHEINPDFIPCLHLLVEIDELLLNYKNITKWASRYIELRPSAEFGYYVRAQAYYKLKDYDSTLNDMIYVVENVSRDAKYYGYIVLLLSKKKEFLRAKKYLKYLKKSAVAYYYNSFGLQLLAQNKPYKAEKFLRAAYAKEQTESFFFSIIDCFIKTRKYNKAMDYLNRFSIIMSDNPDYFHRKMTVCLLNGDKSGAERTTEDYIVKFIGDNTSQQIRNFIYKALALEAETVQKTQK